MSGSVKKLIAFVVLAGIVYGTYSYFIKGSASGQQKMPPTPVGTAKVEQATWQPTYTTFGSVTATHGLVLTPEVSGRISKLNVNSGQEVKQGDIIAEINPSILESSLANAKAAATLAEIKYKRYEVLYAKKAVSSMEYDTYRLDFEQAKATAESLQAQLEQHLLRAPFDGTLGLTKVQVGSFVTAGTTEIVSLQKLQPIWVDLTVPQKLGGKIKVDREVTMTSNAYPDAKETGKVLAVDPNVNTTTRRTSVRIITDNTDEHLKPGSFVTVELPLDEPVHALKVPLLAIETEPAGNFVYVLEQPKVIKTKVELGEQFDDSVLITSGLKEGQIVITDGRMKVHPGSEAVDVQIILKQQQQGAKGA